MSTSGSSASSASSIPKKMILLRSCDGEEFQVEEAAVKESVVLKNLMEDVNYDNNQAIVLDNVNGKILSKVIVFLKKLAENRQSNNVDEAADDEEMMKWNVEFVNDNQDALTDLIDAAHFLDISSLLNLTCIAVADMMKGKTPDELRRMFGVTNDFTPEEEATIRLENTWVYE